jgi:hypothetical protein
LVHLGHTRAISDRKHVGGLDQLQAFDREGAQKMSNWIMYGLLMFYIILLVAAIADHKPYLALYWISAMGITVALLGGMK